MLTAAETERAAWRDLWSWLLAPDDDDAGDGPAERANATGITLAGEQPVASVGADLQETSSVRV